MKTIEKETIIEFEEKKSKFIGYIKPVNTKLEAEEFIQKIKKMHPSATHNCSAYKILEDGTEIYKVDDDGEPSGTAGKPMGEILNVLDVFNLVVVATRYFGGIKLGAGGLIRNYAKTSKLAIEAAKIIEHIERELYILEFPYSLNGEIDRALKGMEENIIDKSYYDKISYKVSLDADTLEKIKDIHNLLLVKL